jgi:NHLM bacteriocin system ABC transporter ATP-binding protein
MATAPNPSQQLLEPPSNQPFLIHEPQSVWIVRSGKLDLFLVQDSAGGTQGARFHFLRVTAGQAVFGMSPRNSDGVSIIATAVPGTQLIQVTRDSICSSRANTSGERTDSSTLSLLDDWIISLGGAASVGTSAPTVFLPLETNSSIEVGDEPAPILRLKGVAWVRHAAGESKFLNDASCNPIQSPSYFPVSRHGWIQATPGSSITAFETDEWVRRDSARQGLESFHDAALQRLLLSREIEEEKGKSRLRLQAASDAVIVRGALRLLASPLENKEAPVWLDDATLTNTALQALAMIGKNLGVTIQSSAATAGSISSVKDYVAAVAQSSNLRHRLVALKGKWWTNSTGPLLAFRESDGSPVALLPSAGGDFVLHDPATHSVKRVDAATAFSLNGFAYTFYRPLPAHELNLWDLLRMGMSNTRREILVIMVMGICAGLLGLVFPIVTGIVFDSIIPGAQHGQLLQICGLLVLATVASSVFLIVRNLAMLRLQAKMGSDLQSAVWDRLLRLSVPFFRNYTSGDLADRSLGIGSILRVMTGSVIFSIMSGVFSIFSFLLLFHYSWQLAVVATALVFAILLRSAISIYFEVSYQRVIARYRGRISGMMLELISNVPRLRISGAEPRAFAVWAKEFGAQKSVSMEAGGVSRNLAAFNAAFPVLSLAVLFYGASQFMGHPLLHALTTGTFLAFLAAFAQFQSAALGMTTAVESALGVIPSYERAMPVLRALPEVAQLSRPPGELSGLIELNHISFRYGPELPLVLDDVSFSAKPGQFVAIVGPSGSGKSSLLRLLLSFEKPEGGSIYFDGRDIAGLDIQAVRRQMGVVLQSARLSSGSIFDNIIGSSPFTLDDAWAAARSAGLEKDIREMPMGMHTVVSEGGTNISNGQRQRLLIARAMVKKPRIFLLDEATSALDNITQTIVSRSLDGFSATRIVVAHRLSTIVNADHVIVLDKGKVIQSGSYRQLLETDGLFRELAKRQLT